MKDHLARARKAVVAGVSILVGELAVVAVMASQTGGGIPAGVVGPALALAVAGGWATWRAPNKPDTRPRPAGRRP